MRIMTTFLRQIETTASRWYGDKAREALVPSSRVRPLLVTTAVALLQLARSLASHLMMLMEGPFMLLSLSCHLVLGIPRLLFPLISPSITQFSIPRSSSITCPKYLKAACATFDSSAHSGLLFSTTHRLLR